jgi:hypothetical protein
VFVKRLQGKLQQEGCVGAAFSKKRSTLFVVAKCCEVFGESGGDDGRNTFGRNVA